MANVMLNHPKYYHYKPVFGMQNTSNESHEATSVPIERVPVATASGNDSEAVQMVSICQLHISKKKFRLTSLEKANTNINVHYMTKNLVRSFVLVVACPRRPTTTIITTTIADRAQLPALREDIFEAGHRKRHVQRALHPSQEGRGGRHLGRRRGELNVVVIYCSMFPLKIPHSTTYKT